MSKLSNLVPGPLFLALLLTACSTAPKSQEAKNELGSQAALVLEQAKKNDPNLVDILRNSVGFAVFPKVGKGAVGVGGAYGKGILYENVNMNGREVGFCDLTQASFGFQLGGQSYSEIIAFENWDAFNKFKSGKFAFDAQATAVAFNAGAGANMGYSHGVAVFTTNEKGLMYEASIGGQKFSYESM